MLNSFYSLSLICSLEQFIMHSHHHETVIFIRNRNKIKLMKKQILDRNQSRLFGWLVQELYLIGYLIDNCRDEVFLGVIQRKRNELLQTYLHYIDAFLGEIWIQTIDFSIFNFHHFLLIKDYTFKILTQHLYGIGKNANIELSMDKIP